MKRRLNKGAFFYWHRLISQCWCTFQPRRTREPRASTKPYFFVRRSRRGGQSRIIESGSEVVIVKIPMLVMLFTGKLPGSWIASDAFKYRSEGLVSIGFHDMHATPLHRQNALHDHTGGSDMVVHVEVQVCILVLVICGHFPSGTVDKEVNHAIPFIIDGNESSGIIEVVVSYKYSAYLSFTQFNRCQSYLLLS